MIDNTGMFFVGLFVGLVAAQQYIKVAELQPAYSQPMRNPIDLGPIRRGQIGGINSHHLFSNMMIDEAKKKSNIIGETSKGTFLDKDKSTIELVDTLPRNAISQPIPIPQNHEVEKDKTDHFSSSTTNIPLEESNHSIQQKIFPENQRTIDTFIEPYSKQSKELFQSDSDMIDKTQKHLFAQIVTALAHFIQFLSINQQNKQIDVNNATLSSSNQSFINTTVNTTSNQSIILQKFQHEDAYKAQTLYNYDASRLEFEEAYQMMQMKRKQKKMYFIISILTIGLVGICLIRRTKEKAMQNVSGESIRLPSEEIQEI